MSERRFFAFARPKSRILLSLLRSSDVGGSCGPRNSGKPHSGMTHDLSRMPKNGVRCSHATTITHPSPLPCGNRIWPRSATPGPMRGRLESSCCPPLRPGPKSPSCGSNIHPAPYPITVTLNAGPSPVLVSMNTCSVIGSESVGVQLCGENVLYTRMRGRFTSTRRYTAPMMTVTRSEMIAGWRTMSTQPLPVIGSGGGVIPRTVQK